MKYRKIKYLGILIVPAVTFLIWFLFFISPVKNNPGIKNEAPASISKKEIIITGEIKKGNNSSYAEKEIRKIKKHYKEIKPVENKQSNVISDKSELLNNDTLAIQNLINELEGKKQNIPGNKIILRTPPVITEIPRQVISLGQKFPAIDLNQFEIDTVNNHGDITWKFSGNKYLHFSINNNKLLNAELPADDWYGTDTLTLIASNSSDLSSSEKIIFQVREPDLINRKPIKQIKDILVTGVEDVLSFTVNPIQWETDDYIIAATFIGSTFLLTRVDDKIQEMLVGNKNYENNTLMNIGKFYGETSTSQYTSLGLALLGLTTDNEKITRMGLEVFESYLIADRITYLLKYVFGRDRPSKNNGALNFDLFPKRENNINSLPSGHATNAFALSTVLSSYTSNLYLKILIYSPAFITALSRVYQNYHWTSDVFLGGTIGYIVGSFLVNRHNKIFSGRLSFLVDTQGRIGVVYKF